MAQPPSTPLPPLQPLPRCGTAWPPRLVFINTRSGGRDATGGVPKRQPPRAFRAKLVGHDMLHANKEAARASFFDVPTVATQSPCPFFVGLRTSDLLLGTTYTPMYMQIPNSSGMAFLGQEGSWPTWAMGMAVLLVPAASLGWLSGMLEDPPPHPTPYGQPDNVRDG
mmetsp:Transcript_133598/g.231693  ORF Transcript_133598/g.231693 Transcript_133598/m.231693 type:complete len:167 (-) Transcript_133598:71-571(-)